MVEFIKPGEINGYQKEYAEHILNEVIMCLLVKEWKPFKAMAVVSLLDVVKLLEREGFNPFVFSWGEKILQSLLDEYVDGGWGIERYGNIFHFYGKGDV